MLRQLRISFLAFGVLWASLARADVVVTLEPMDAALNPVEGPVAPGSVVLVDVMLSATGDDNPLADVRGIKFDFAGTSPTLELTGFTWMLGPEFESMYLSFDPPPLSGLPLPQIVTPQTAGPVLGIDDTPTRVTVTGSGTLDAGTTVGTGPGAGALVSAGFINRVDYTVENGNLTVEPLTLQVEGSVGPDRDGDGVTDSEDQFPDDPSESLDTDEDGTGDNADTDDDNDGVADEEDRFPSDPAETTDTDGDGLGDNTDIDDDGDGVFDEEDAFPQDESETTDTDGDGLGDNTDADDDGDGVLDPADPDPLDPEETGNGGAVDDQDTNTGPRVTGGPCGFGMLGTSILILLGLSVVSLRRRCPGSMV